MALRGLGAERSADDDMLGGGEDDDGAATPGLSAGFPGIRQGPNSLVATSTGEVLLATEGRGRRQATRNAQALAKKKKKGGGFQSLGISRPVLNAIMRQGYKVPTPIQRATLPIALSGHDVVAMARTGSGKTAAFLIPMVERLVKHSTQMGARALVISPTRELSLQTHKFAKAFTKFTDLRSCLLVGGTGFQAQFQMLANNPDIIIATPGRLMHLLMEVSDLQLGRIEMLVFDEADRLFEMGFAEQLKEIMKRMPSHRQTLLFSATIPKQLAEFARAGLHEPEMIRLDVEHSISDKLKNIFLTVRSQEKVAALLWIIEDVLPADQQCMVFAATRHHVDFLVEILRKSNHKSVPVYGVMDQVARSMNLAAFRARRCRILVVTDVAARGIDVPLLDNVINYEFPPQPKLFVHRVGRVARQNRPGMAFNIVTHSDVPYMLDTLLFLGRPAHNEYIDEDGEATSYTTATMEPEHVHYGALPAPIMGDKLETVAQLLSRHSTELAPLVKVSNNAFKQYCKTRPEASHQSVVRARTLNMSKVHPLVLSFAGAGAKQLTSFIDNMATFRPPETILEVTAKKKGSTVAAGVMREKRYAHASAIRQHRGAKADAEEQDGEGGDGDDSDDNDMEAMAARAAAMKRPVQPPVRKKRRMSKAERKRLAKSAAAKSSAADASSGTAGGGGGAGGGAGATASTTTKAERRQQLLEEAKSQYIVSEAPLAGTEAGLTTRRHRKGAGFSLAARLESAVLDITPDTRTGLAENQRVKHWDKRKKKYVSITVGELTGKTKLRSADGTRLSQHRDAAHGKMYSAWQKKTHKRIGRGLEEDRDATTKKGGADGPRRAKHGERLLSSDQVRKARIAKAKEMARQAGKGRGGRATARAGKDAAMKKARAKIAARAAPSRSKVIIRSGKRKR